MWSYYTTPRTSTGETPYSLVYGFEVVIPKKVEVTSARVETYNNMANEEELRMNLDFLEERRNQISIRKTRYKEAMAKYYNLSIKEHPIQSKRLSPA